VEVGPPRSLSAWASAAVFLIAALFACAANAYGVVPKGAGTWRYGTAQSLPYTSASDAATAAYGGCSYPYSCTNNWTCPHGAEGTAFIGSYGSIPARVHTCTRPWSQVGGPGGTHTFLVQAGLVPGVCPQDSAEASGQCICNTGFKAQGNSCVVINCQSVVDGLSASSLVWSGNSSRTCYQGCNVSCGVRGYQTATNTSSCSGQFVSTDSSSCQGASGGANSTGSDNGTGTNSVVCGPGKCPGTVNGTPVCVACTSTTQGPSTSASAPSAASSPPLPGAPPGAVTSDQQTTVSGGRVTVTTTYRDAGGNVVGETTEAQEEKSFCAENPNLQICKDSAISGSCDAVQCNGDAVQCAIAREQSRRNCEFFSPTGAAVDAGNDAVQGGTRPPGHPGATASQVSMTLASQLDQTDRLGGSCPGDVALPFFGASVALPLSTICPALQMAGQAIVAFCLLAAAFIVFRG
jgi:hypothetical protein